MKATVRIRTALLSVLALSLVILTMLVLGTSKYNSPNQYELVQLDTGWTITRGDNSWYLRSVKQASIGIANRMDVITLKNRMPDSSLSPATISFRTILSSVKVYLEDDLIYTYGDDHVQAGRMLPKMEHFVQLPDGYQGKDITIELTAWENNAFSGLSPIYFGNYNDIKNQLIQTRRISTAIGVYLCHLGFMLLILAPFLALADNHDFSIFFSAVTSVMMGVYILCYNDIFWYLADSPSFYTFVEYFTLFMIPASILGFIITAGYSKFKTLGNSLFILNLCFTILTSLLHLTGIVHICHFLPWLHVIAVVEGIFVIVSLSISAVQASRTDDEFRLKSLSTNTLIMGLIFFTFCAVTDIIKFNIMKYSKLGEMNAHINFMTVGALIFVMTLLVNYFYHCIEYINESTVKAQLEGLAYTDTLTALSNRSRCELVLAEISGDYTIISLDLDYLKYTNDNYGHIYGDKLLSGFSDILRSCFTDASLIGRMGGDEFIVILPFVDSERTERDLNGLSDQLSHRNQVESKLRFSASWGYASSKEKELGPGADAHKVYLLADQRMYLMKNQHHQVSLKRLYDDLLNKMLEKEVNRHEK